MLTMKFIKIGYSGNLEQRNSAIQGNNPQLLGILASAPGNRSLELKVHHLFWNCRTETNGEWFEDCPKLREFIACVNKTGNIEEAVDIVLHGDWGPINKRDLW